MVPFAVVTRGAIEIVAPSGPESETIVGIGDQ